MKQPIGKYIEFEGAQWYEIRHYETMQPFFISLASDVDLWMYLSSTGGLTCGRRNPNKALFPYYTDDKVTESYRHTGPHTIICVPGQRTPWEPFSDFSLREYDVERRILKSVVGNEIMFVEENKDLGLTFSYRWAGTDKYGWIRRCSLQNSGDKTVQLDLTDGLRNVLPSGTDRITQNTYSTLVDGYKRTEKIEGLPLVLFRMEAIMVDRAEPSECLRCNTAMVLGLEGADFPNTDSKGVRGNVYVHKPLTLAPGEGENWLFALDVDQDACSVRAKMEELANPTMLKVQVEEAIFAATCRLRTIVAQNDGILRSGDAAADARHFANVLFNTMRGGYYVQEHPGADEADDYLPLTFGRRHGDPSRPWNLFDIRVRDEKGQPIVSYQGNWRDIFQNWEALSVSYPAYVNRIIAKFLNATTIDGYNPYKVTDKGYEWEVINPDDPWSNIGYWGDHQIIYLSKLLELSFDHDPKALLSLLGDRRYTYAHVPYRLKTYAEIVADPKNSIIYDEHMYDDVQLPHASMTEKILVTLLAKLSNYIPDAGIWMNTLRPEWNDANNALVGNGASMVTLCYIRRFVTFLRKLYLASDAKEFPVAVEVDDLLTTVWEALDEETDRRAFIDTVGSAGEQYRAAAYRGLSGEMAAVLPEVLVSFFDSVLEHIDRSIAANKRTDGLYEAYNIVTFGAKTVEIGHLYPMLEGQVAVLSSYALSGKESADLLDAMRQSDLYRADQNSYMLYPARRRALFLEKNNLPEDVKSWPEYDQLCRLGIFAEDCKGGVHFNASYNNASFIPAVENAALAARLSDLYERTFRHVEFTGRSGTFYKYEGLGCIYWHMVSKLLLAVGETIAREPEGSAVLPKLMEQYRDVEAGIGAHKSPAEYGSFPFDPYSHTPSMAGVQQPGMTGQVKEDILSRWFCLGLRVEDGCLSIYPTMLRREDFDAEGHIRFTYCGVELTYTLCDDKKYGVTRLDAETSRKIFLRTGEIMHLDVNISL